jgi:uncharacterized protein (DUF1800 family)
LKRRGAGLNENLGREIMELLLRASETVRFM